MPISSSVISKLSLLSLLCTASAIAFADSPAHSTENPSAEPPPMARIGVRSHIRADGGNAVAAVFAARWQPADREFVVTDDGKLQASNPDGVDSAGRNEHTHFGYVGSDPDFIETRAPSAPATPPAANGAAANVPECGPSPASPEKIKQLVTDAAERYNVDPIFALAIAFAESNFDRSRNSPKGARGPMQLMPATAARFGVADVCDPASNIGGGVRYLKELADEFRNPMLVAAAYNAGEQRVRDYGGVPPFAETVGYVAKVVNYQLGLPPLNPAKAGHFTDPITTSANDLATPQRGVITTAKRREWVGGVMHF